MITHSKKLVFLSALFLSATIIFVINNYLLGFDQHGYAITTNKDLFTLSIANRDGRFYQSGAMKSEFDFNLLLPFLARVVVIDVDDCLDELKINQTIIRAREIPYCNYQRPIEINLPSYFASNSFYPLYEKWSVSLKFTNKGGPGNIHFRIKPEPRIELLLRIAELLCSTLFFFLLAWQFRKSLK